MRGLSLIELMVGATIGMVCVIVMFQVMILWEKNRATTSAGSDAQISGAVGAFELERSIKHAGLGFSSANIKYWNCPVTGANSSLSAATKAITFNLLPAQIVRDAGGGPDQIRVLYGNSPYAADYNDFKNSTTTTKQLNTSQAAFRNGDVIVAMAEPAAGVTCEMLQVTDISNPDGQTIKHEYNVDFVSSYTPAAGVIKSPFNPAAGSNPAVNLGTIVNLGPEPHLDIWTLDTATNTLRVNNRLLSDDQISVAENVVDFRAQYGTVTDPVLNTFAWQPLSWVPLTGADFQTIRAIKFAFLVRSPQYETEAIYPGSAVPSWSGGDFTMRDTNGAAPTNSPDATNWRHYRYRIYEQAVSFRNVMWAMRAAS